MTLAHTLAFAIAGFLIGFGDGGNGKWSPYLSIAGGLIWLGAIVNVFVLRGVSHGLMTPLFSFLAAAITMPLGSAAAAKLRGR